jgi:hypothetical protein
MYVEEHKLSEKGIQARIGPLDCILGESQIKGQYVNKVCVRQQPVADVLHPIIMPFHPVCT